ncbi:MAG TPA: alpha-amylase family glycosyl hydrolase [Pirellulales bacterium]|nr:alpha-amylase family glycosyl hydrolase [Pirellulales bacterium]
MRSDHRTLQAILVVTLIACPVTLSAQSGFDDDRVMLQGFYWESYRHGNPKFPQFGTRKWYDIVRDNVGVVRDARFDLIWLPPPCWAGEESAGYNPKQYWKLDNSYGDSDKQRGVLEALLTNGVEPVADIVINHRDGETKWADFKNPDWGTKTICRNDEAFSNHDSEVYNTPVSERGADEEHLDYDPSRSTAYGYGDFRDLDHTNPQVRRDIIKYLLQLKSAGYRGWRYDMAHGYHARWVALYNKRTGPTFSVGEYDWGDQPGQRGWVYYTATTPGDLRTSSDVFDFTTQFTLKDNKGSYGAWYGFGNGLGVMGDTTDGLPWKQRASTFLENHDTGYRTNDDGTPQKDHQFDSFENNWQVEQAYAYVLTHPGVPCVYWKHYFDWGSDLKEKIKALINARKAAGVTSGSQLYLQDNARQKVVYAARVVGKRGDLYVRIGGSGNDWQPSFSGYQNYRDYAHGNGWAVWVALPGNPAVQQAPLKAALPVPTFKAGPDIDVPDDWLN